MASQWLKTLSHKAAHVRMLHPVYSASLGKLKNGFEFQTYPHDLFGGDAGRGRWMASGQLDIQGNRVDVDFKHWFINSDTQPTPYFSKLHGFDFLLELKSLGGEAGRRSMRAITTEWLEQFETYNHVVWAPDLTANRLVNWLTAYPFGFETANDDFIDRLHICIYRQYHHLINCLSMPNMDLFDRYACLWALIIVQCHCDDLFDEVQFNTHLQLLKGVLDDITLPDDGLIDRNSQNYLEIAKTCLMLRQSLQIAHKKIPLWLPKIIDKMVRVLNGLLHQDKDFPHFQGAVIPNKDDIAKVTTLSGLRTRRHDMQLKDTGYTAINKSRTSIIIDHGSGGVHTSPLAFEICHANNRMVVNCGTYFKDPGWAQGLAGISAHNCLVFGDADPKLGAFHFKPSMERMNGACLFSCSHEGYKKEFGATHTRRVYVDAKGEDIRGEDLLVRNIALRPIDFVSRFHLHPMVKAVMAQDKSHVILRLNNGSGWIFTADDNVQLGLEDSIHCADGFTRRKSQQIVIKGQMDDLTCASKWTFKRQ